MDYEELSRIIAKELGGNVPAEVEAKLRLGKPRTSWVDVVFVAATVGDFLVRAAELAIRIAETEKTPEQLIAALQAKTASATKIAKEKRDKIIKRIVELLTGSK